MRPGSRWENMDVSARADRIEELFHAARELEREERERYLARACAQDSGLRREVEALLALDALPDERLDRAAPGMLAPEGSPSNLLIGRRLGPYSLRRCLASGGMGAVYEAEQEHPRRTVALKVLRADVASEELERRFRVEASFLARLQHPAIACVYEAGVSELDGTRVPWIALELVEGARAITAFAREEALEPRARIHLFAEVCDAVHHGHQRGVIHRDLKPANILVDVAGRPKLIDFGIARAADPAGSTQRTEAGALLGTVQYMSPEQCVDARDLDVRSDVYSLGVVLYELLCERLPHDLQGVPLPEVVRIVRERPARRPSAVLRALRGDLEAILLTALEKDRERRYQSASALAQDLRRYLRREPIAAHAPSSLHRLALFTRRHRALVGSLSAVFLAALSAAAVSARFAWRELRAREREEISSCLANIAAADLSLRTHDAAGARRRLESIPARRRGWEWDYLRGRLRLALGVLEGPQSYCESVAFQGGRIAATWHYETAWITLCDERSGAELARSGPLEPVPTRLALAGDGAIVWGGLDGRLRRWDPSTGSTQAFEGRHEQLVTGVCVTPDDLVVSASLDGTVRVWDLERGLLRSTIFDGQGSVSWRDLAVARDGRRVAVGGGDGSVRVLALDGGEEVALGGGAGAVLAVAFDPGGTSLATGGSEGIVRVWNLATGRELVRLAGHESDVQDLAFSPDGELLVSASIDRTVRVWDVAQGVARAVLHGHEARAKCLAFSEDGRRLVSGGYDGTVRVWDPRAETGPRRIDAHASYVRDLAFAPEGRLLATASFDRTVELIDMATREVVATLGGHGDRVTSVAFHPGGALLASASFDGAVRIWDTASGSCLRTLREHEDGVLTLAFSPRGELATGSRDGRVLLHGPEDLGVRSILEHELGVEQLAFDPRGERLAVIVNDGTLVVWDVGRERELWRRAPAGLLHDVGFSPDGELLALAAGDYDGTDLGIVLLDGRAGEERARLSGHTDVVLALAFTPDGRRLASGAADGTVRIWDPAAVEEALVLRGHESWVFAVAFSPDGSLLASGGGSEGGAGIGVRLWEAGR